MTKMDERITELLKRHNLAAPNRFSMPNEMMGSSKSSATLNNNDAEVEFSVQKKNPRKKAQAVSSVKPKKEKKLQENINIESSIPVV